ncbi:MAG: hypothetical protein IT455_00780 [Planctomycetes bacterium]|nr:hypothetical protein [Planctomycetota bacterium]
MWCGALAGVAAAQQLPPFVLPPPVAAAIHDKVAREPFLLLRELLDVDQEHRQAARDRWQLLEPKQQVALVRAGLRQDGEVGVGAAVAAGAGLWLDRAECKRAVALGLARCNQPNTPFDLDAFFDLMDGADTARLLAHPGPLPRAWPQFLGPLHQRFGSEHAVALEQLARGDDLLLRQEARRFLSHLHVDRELYARLLLALPDQDEVPDGRDPFAERVAFMPRHVALRAASVVGFPPLLAALLERAAAGSPVLKEPDAAWLWRWARQARPGAADRALLLQLAPSATDLLAITAVEGLQRLAGADDEVDAALRAVAARAPDQGDAGAFALAALAARGHAAARRQLTAAAAAWPMALLLLWRLDPAAVHPLLERAFAAGGAATLEAVLTARTWAGWYGLALDGLDTQLITRAEAAELDGVRLAMLLDEPELRTLPLAMRAIEVLDAASLHEMPLGVLEVVDAAALTARLQSLLGTPQGTVDERKLLSALVALGGGDAAAASAVWRAVQQGGDAADRAGWQFTLAAGGHPEASAAARALLARESWLANDAHAGDLGLLLAANGVAPELAHSVVGMCSGASNPAVPEFATILLPALRAGDGAGAIAALCARGPAFVGELRYLGACRSAAVRAHLERCRDEREHGQYRWAIAELARSGDGAARAEIEAVITHRLYRWLDDLDCEVLTDGAALARVPLLLDQLDTNCCTFAVVGSALGQVFEVDAFQPEWALVGRVGHLRSVWGRAQGHQRWSRIAHRWLILP